MQELKEKHATIALLNNLKNREHDNIALQAQRDLYLVELQKCKDTITHLKTRYVPHAKDPGRDNIITNIWKHTTPVKDKFHDLPYYIARIQRCKRLC